MAVERSARDRQSVEPTTQSREPSPAAPDENATYRLRVISGPDSGASLLMDGSRPSRSLLGTGDACDLRLTDPEVSRRQVAVDLERGVLRLVDLGSTNGTFVDNVRVIEGLLLGGETVRVGGTLLRAERTGASAASPPMRASFGRVIGASVAMGRLYALCERVAASNIAVLIEGETGTGKEVLAEALHEQGERRSAPFVVFDCTAVQASLLESELFGHERGAFTGAVNGRAGLLEQADGGTLLIDEIGDLDLSLQPKLLRAVERQEIRRVGGTRLIKLDVRILAATRRNLDEEVQKGRFRDDLFHRLAVARMELPPLRRRAGDVMVLARHFLRQIGSNPDDVSSAVYRRWEDYGWPGNVRELRNAVARQVALGEWSHPVSSASSASSAPESTDGDSIRGGARDDIVSETLRLGLPFVHARQRVYEDFEQRYLERVLADHGNNVGKAAAAAGVGRRYFQRLRARTR